MSKPWILADSFDVSDDVIANMMSCDKISYHQKKLQTHCNKVSKEKPSLKSSGFWHQLAKRSGSIFGLFHWVSGQFPDRQFSKDFSLMDRSPKGSSPNRQFAEKIFLQWTVPRMDISLE